jgi:hypothetical protein
VMAFNESQGPVLQTCFQIFVTPTEIGGNTF